MSCLVRGCLWPNAAAWDGRPAPACLEHGQLAIESLSVPDQAAWEALLNKKDDITIRSRLTAGL